MLQIETYRGTVEELVEFVNAVWAHSYAGRMTFPRWTPDFFDWQFRLGQDVSRRNLIAAYEGPVLAGVLLGTNYLFHSPNGLHPGSQWSWLSIHPDFRGHGIAKALHQERLVRQAEDKSRLIVSFRYVGSRYSQAERPDAYSADPKFNRKIGFWARVIDARRFADWHWSPMEGFLGKIASPFCRIPKTANADDSVRPYAVADTDACLELVRESYSSLALSIAWNRDLLRHQLGGGDVSQTLVLKEQGRISGFVNFHTLYFRAKTEENVAILDMVVLGKSSSRGRVRLLNAALASMQNQGVILALKLRCGDTPAWPLLRTHFVPQLPDSFLVLQSVSEPISIPKSAPVHLLWR